MGLKFVKKRFKYALTHATKNACFKSLLKEKEHLSKGKELKYDELKGQNYMMPGYDVFPETIFKILSIRIKDIDV